MSLAVRRFPHTITRRRQGPDTRNEYGETVPGPVVELALRASVQPLKLEDADIAGGVQLSERLRVYVRETDALLAAFDGHAADKVVWQGETFVVEETRAWHGSHTRCTILRET